VPPPDRSEDKDDQSLFFFPDFGRVAVVSRPRRDARQSSQSKMKLSKALVARCSPRRNGAFETTTT
jgi:hypothetical protein